MRVGIAVVVALTGCEGGAGSPADGVARPPSGIDLLLVIDNSGSMLSKQMNFGRALPAFVDELRRATGTLPDLQVGVVSTDLPLPESIPVSCQTGSGGVLRVLPGCGVEPSARFLSAFDDGVRTNAGGELSATLDCMVQLGAFGCGFEHQLESVRVALTAPESAAFLRTDALLAIVVLTDEDDCSYLPAVARPDAAHELSEARAFCNGGRRPWATATSRNYGRHWRVESGAAASGTRRI